MFWQGNDDGAGIEYYNIYMAEGEGDYELWISNSMKESDTIRVNPELMYHFFSMAVDKLGNTEEYKGYPEESLGIEDLMLNPYKLSISPNPLRDISRINYQLKHAGKSGIRIYNPTGQLVKSFPEKYQYPGEYTVELKASDFAKGTYLIKIFGDEGESNLKFTVF